MSELQAPPASKEAVKSLPTVTITKEHKGWYVSPCI